MSPRDMKRQGSGAMMHRAIPTRIKRLVLKHETARPVTTDNAYQAHRDDSNGGGARESLLISCAMRVM
jgi:hypothetical protein